MVYDVLDLNNFVDQYQSVLDECCAGVDSQKKRDSQNTQSQYSEKIKQKARQLEKIKIFKTKIDLLNHIFTMSRPE